LLVAGPKIPKVRNAICSYLPTTDPRCRGRLRQSTSEALNSVVYLMIPVNAARESSRQQRREIMAQVRRLRPLNHDTDRTTAKTSDNFRHI